MYILPFPVKEHSATQVLNTKRKKSENIEGSLPSGSGPCKLSKLNRSSQKRPSLSVICNYISSKFVTRLITL